MKKTTFTREQTAHLVEKDLTRVAGVIRNLILENKAEIALSALFAHPRVQFWTESIEKLLSETEK